MAEWQAMYPPPPPHYEQAATLAPPPIPPNADTLFVYGRPVVQVRILILPKPLANLLTRHSTGYKPSWYKVLVACRREVNR